MKQATYETVIYDENGKGRTYARLLAEDKAKRASGKKEKRQRPRAEDTPTIEPPARSETVKRPKSEALTPELSERSKRYSTIIQILKTERTVEATTKRLLINFPELNAVYASQRDIIKLMQPSSKELFLIFAAMQLPKTFTPECTICFVQETMSGKPLSLPIFACMPPLKAYGNGMRVATEEKTRLELLNSLTTKIIRIFDTASYPVYVDFFTTENEYVEIFPDLVAEFDVQKACNRLAALVNWSEIVTIRSSSELAVTDVERIECIGAVESRYFAGSEQLEVTDTRIRNRERLLASLPLSAQIKRSFAYGAVLKQDVLYAQEGKALAKEGFRFVIIPDKNPTVYLDWNNVALPPESQLFGFYPYGN